jgi:UDP-N-acetylmuramate dehydrogenase
MDIKQDYPLANLTTFHIGGPAKFYAKVTSADELRDVLQMAKDKKLPILILSSGSNMLVSDQGFDGLVVEVDFKGMNLVADETDSVELKIGSGEIWDFVVAWAVENNVWGIENLSWIPGKTGAVPVQNVGAYGQEASRVISKVEALKLDTGELQIFSNNECGFGYRKSNFNTIWKHQFIILSVNFKLSKHPAPNLSYIDVKNYFAGQPNPSLAQIRQAIISIRQSKFPDLSQLGCAGSFFKNLILDEAQYQVLEQNIKSNFSSETVERLLEIKNKFPSSNGIKIPTAFLIDICGLKGKAVGGAQLWEKQALVIVNTGSAKALDVLGLFRLVRQTVFQKTGMKIVNEPELVGFSEEELKDFFKF